MLVSDFAMVWHAPETDNTERKRLLAHLIEDATLTRKDYLVRLGMRLRGGINGLWSRSNRPSRELL